MRGRAIIPLIVGLGIGLLALKVFVNVLQKAKAAPASTVPVVFAMTNIEPTLEIQDSMIEVRNVPKEAVPETGFSDKKDVVGRVASWPIPKGCPIGSMQLAAKGTPAGMAVRIKDGFRAVAVKIDESAGVAGWLKAGSRVDVVALMDRVERGANKAISKVILQNVEVLAVGQDIGRASDTAAELARSVTLLVSPADVPKLHLAETRGKLRLAMRNQRDAGIGQENSTTDNQLLALNDTTESPASSGGGSLLNAFFKGQAKVQPDQTDKTMQLVEATPAKTDQQQPWIVEVYRGQENMEAVQFERNAGDWQRVSGKGDSKKAPLMSKGSTPSLLPARNGAAASGVNIDELSKPQAKGLESGGPAEIQ